jgi:hypothetical protein
MRPDLVAVEAARSELSRELAADERLVWCGRPRGGVRLRAADAFLVPFTFLWAGFAMFWEMEVLKTGAPTLFAVWGIPFILVGLYITVGRFLVDAVLRRHTLYGLTDQRALIVSTLGGRRVQVVNLLRVAEITLVEHRDQSGTISFGPSSPWAGLGLGFGRWGASRYAPPQFQFIDEPRAVFEKARAAQGSSR